jgi:hypothetical protein
VNVLPSRSIGRVFVQPDDDVPVGRVVSETLEPLERVTERLSAGHHRVNAQSSARGAKQFEYVVLHDEDPVVGEKPLHQYVKAARVNLAVAHRFQMLGSQFDVLRKDLVHRIGIEAVDVRAAMAEVLGEDTGNQAFSDAALPLQHEANRGRSGPLRQIRQGSMHRCLVCQSP